MGKVFKNGSLGLRVGKNWRPIGELSLVISIFVGLTFFRRGLVGPRLELVQISQDPFKLRETEGRLQLRHFGRDDSRLDGITSS